MENLNFKVVAQFIAELLSKSFEKAKKYRNFCHALQDFLLDQLASNFN